MELITSNIKTEFSNDFKSMTNSYTQDDFNDGQVIFTQTTNTNFLFNPFTGEKIDKKPSSITTDFFIKCNDTEIFKIRKTIPVLAFDDWNPEYSTMENAKSFIKDYINTFDLLSNLIDDNNIDISYDVDVNINGINVFIPLDEFQCIFDSIIEYISIDFDIVDYIY